MAELKKKEPLSHIGVVFRHAERLDPLRDFYETVLGMERLWVTPTGATGFRAGKVPGPTFIVDSVQQSPDAKAAFNFETNHVAAFHRSLQAEGVSTTEVQNFDDRTALFHFTDPDGYTLMIWGCNQ